MRLARTLLSAATLAVLVGSLAAAAILVALVQREAATLPDLAAIRDYRPAVTSRITAADGSLIGRFAEENRTLAPLEAIPPIVVRAFVSAEDRHFWTHGGVDPVAIARAALTNLRNRGTGRRAVGASTITQQVVKNLVLGDEATLRRKLREALLALRAEREVGKRRILEIYLNEIYLGEGAYGVAAAAQAYFGRPLDRLGLAEAAFLAGLPKAPHNYHPVRRPEAALARRAYVLGRMVEDGAITPEEAVAAAAAPLPRPAGIDLGGAADGHFAEEVRRQVVARFGAEALYRGGLRVRASMDPALQAAAERALRDGLAAYDRRHGWRGPAGRLPVGTDLADPASWRPALAAADVPAGAGDWRVAAVLAAGRDATLGFPDGATGILAAGDVGWARPATGRGPGPAPRRAADVLAPGDVVLVEAADGPAPRLALRQIPEAEGSLVAIEVRTGRVVALAGGFSHERSSFNRATQALRQPGSAFKPFVYLAAIELGYDPTSPVLDAPIAIDVGSGAARWRPGNYGGSGAGLITLRTALEKSKNLSTVRLLHEIGPERVADVSRRFGLHDSIPNYAAALGALEITNFRLTAAYAMLANGGRRLAPTLIEEVEASDGSVLMRAAEAPAGAAARVADPVALSQLTSMLEGVVRRGTAAAALGGIDLPLAGKTGTTDGNRDAWFVGFSPDLAVGVHVGFDLPRDLGARETGGSAAAPIFGAFMKAAHALRPPSSRAFPLPPGARAVRLDPVTGEPARDGIEEIVRETQDPASPRAAVESLR